MLLPPLLFLVLPRSCVAPERSPHWMRTPSMGRETWTLGGFVSTFYPRPEPKYIFCVHVICHVYQLCQAAMQHAPSRWRLMFREAASA